MSIHVDDDLTNHLDRFGLSSFRPGQHDVISAVLAGHDCLCIMPTGGGKSLCYQLPSVAREGVTLVVSPLIALMKDQVDALESLGIEATCINSSLSFDEQLARLERMAAGGYDLVYIAPERLRNRRFLDAVAGAKVQLLAVDEAHCISEWGHDFRPDYARLAMFRQRLGSPQTIALTATATARVREDIVKSLALQTPKTFVTGFARPNLHFEVAGTSTHREKEETLLDFLAQNPGAGILYASTRKRCEEIAEIIGPQIDRRLGVYHAGLMPDDRRRVQEAFMKGELPIIVATNAFGMGIDKADLRFVVHYNIPGSLEAYYQEAGRAGRDGHDSRCLLLYSYSDRYVQEFFIESAYPPAEVVRQVYQYLCSRRDDPIELTLQEVKERLGLSISNEGVGTCEKLLEKSGVIERLDTSENLASIRIDHDLPTTVDLLPREAKTQRRVLRALERIVGDRRSERVFFQLRALMHNTEMDREAITRALRELSKLEWVDYVPPFRGRAVHFRQRGVPFDELEIDFKSLEERRAAEYAKLEQVIQYASTRRCRQVEILDYFGDPERKRCGNCDNCLAAGFHQREQAALPPAAGADPASTGLDEPVVEAVRIALSGVARGHGRVGKQLIAQMLCGSKSSKVKQLRLNSLSTFGLLGYLRQQDVTEMLDCLIDARLIEQVETQRFRPLVQISDMGASVMRGTEPLPDWFRLPTALAKKVMARHRELQRGKKTARTVAAGEPAAGPPLAVAAAPVPDRRAAAAEPTPVARPQSPRDETVAPSARPSFYWTWRLLDAGFSPRECEQIRGLSGDQILDHAVRAAEEGRQVPIAWFLAPEQIAQLSDSLDPTAATPPAELMKELSQSFGRQHIQLFLLDRNGKA